MTRQITQPLAVGDIVELRKPVCNSTWRMKITEMKLFGQFIGELVSSTYPEDTIGATWSNEYLKDYFKV